MSSKTSCIPKPRKIDNEDIKVGRDPEFEAINCTGASGTEVAVNSEESITTTTKPSQIGVIIESPNKSSSKATESINTIVTESKDLPGTGFRVNGNSTRWKVKFENDGQYSSYRFGPMTVDKDDKNVRYFPAVFNLTSVDVQRWRSAREAMDQYGLKKPNTSLDLVTVKPIPESEGFDNPKRHSSTWARFGFTFVAASYGGLHALAWDAHFPSRQELILWRVSALFIASPVALFVLAAVAKHIFIIITKRFRSLYRKCNPDSVQKPTGASEIKQPVGPDGNSSQNSTRFARVTKVTLQFLDKATSEVLFPALVFPYLFARAYLVYESFRTVFFLPPEAYEATKWTQYLPHIT